jgi:hypothetical protein
MPLFSKSILSLRVVLYMFLHFFISVWLIACSDSSVTTSTTAPIKPQTIEMAQRVEYASNVGVKLSYPQSPIPDGVTLSQISLIEGEAKDWALINNEIRFLSPGDLGKDTTVKFKITLADKDVILPVTLYSARYVAPKQDVGDGPDPDPNGPKLIVTGLGSGNMWLGGEMTLSLSQVPKLSADLTVYISTDSIKELNLKNYAKLSPAADKVVISAADMQTIVSQLPKEQLSLNVSLADGSVACCNGFQGHWSMSGLKPTQAVLRGQLVDITGNPVATGEGKWLAVRGMGNENGTRQVVQVQAGGTFTATDLIAGGYHLELLDVNHTHTWLGVATVSNNSTDIAVKVLYDLAFVNQANPTVLKSIKANAETATGVFDPKLANSVSVLTHIANAVPSSNEPIDPVVAQRRELAHRQAVHDLNQSTSQNTSTISKEVVIANPSTCAAPGSAASSTVYTVSSAAMGTVVTCGLTHSVPKGTQTLGLQFVVSTAEYPYYTQSKSKFNDSWAYFVTGVTGVANQTSLVNDSHFSTDSITKDYCVDVSAQTKDQAFKFSAGLSSSNVGDSSLATTVRLTVVEGCAEKLKVLNASINTQLMVRPLNTGADDKNKSGEYLSIPVANAQNAWGIPLNVEYEPKKTKITKVRVGILSNGTVTMAEDDLIGQVTSKSEGKLTFNELKIPRIGNAPVSGKINFLVELTGIDEQGTTSTSKPEDGKANYAGVQSFTPLYLAAETVTADARRYGARDTGGDSWARKTTIDWLQSRTHRFDDISALHVKQTATGRSVMDHAGHSDGTQIDMRYSDGNGGFTETLGGATNGAGILAMLNAAQAEVSAGGTTAKPNLTQTIAWIAANRTMISAAAPSARRIYVGDTWLNAALLNGRFANNALIPGIGTNNSLLPNGGPGAWATRPALIRPAPSHLNHWHISLAAD